jgi:hypothetical protein
MRPHRRVREIRSAQQPPDPHSTVPQTAQACTAPVVTLLAVRASPLLPWQATRSLTASLAATRRRSPARFATRWSGLRRPTPPARPPARLRANPATSPCSLSLGLARSRWSLSQSVSHWRGCRCDRCLVRKVNVLKLTHSARTVPAQYPHSTRTVPAQCPHSARAVPAQYPTVPAQCPHSARAVPHSARTVPVHCPYSTCCLHHQRSRLGTTRCNTVHRGATQRTTLQRRAPNCNAARHAATTPWLAGRVTSAHHARRHTAPVQLRPEHEADVRAFPLPSLRCAGSTHPHSSASTEAVPRVPRLL